MAKQWLSASDPEWGEGYIDNDAGGAYYHPYGSTIAGLTSPDNWRGVARQLGYQGPFETQVYATHEGGYDVVPAPEFLQFIGQKKAEGYDFVTKADQINQDRQTIGFRLPSGEVVNQTPVKVSGFGDFFKEFLLPAAGIAFGMGGLNSLMGGAAAPANALTGVGLGAMEGVGLTGNIVNAATGQTIASLPTAAMTAADIGRGLGDVLGAASDTATGAGGVIEVAGSVPDFLSGMSDVAATEGPGVAGTGILTKGTNIPSTVLGGGTILDQAIDLLKTPAGQAVVGAVGSVASGVMQAEAAEDVAQQQAGAAENALKLLKDMFEYQKGLLEPYRTAGEAALGRLSGAMGLGGPAQQQQMLEMDPGYGFRLGEGMKALERMQAARGNMLSGGALKAGQRYAQDYASGEYQNAFNRLADIAGIGRSTAAQQGSAAQQFGQTAGQTGMEAANALAAGRYGRTSAYTGALEGALGAYENYLNRQQRNQVYRDIYGRMLGGGG